MIELLAEVMLVRGIPEHIRSDNGPEFTATALRRWLQRTGAYTLYIAPASPFRALAARVQRDQTPQSQ